MVTLHNTTYNFIRNQNLKRLKITVHFRNVFEAPQALSWYLTRCEILVLFFFFFHILNSWIPRYNHICVVSTIVFWSLHKIDKLPRQFKLRESHWCPIASVSYAYNSVITPRAFYLYVHIFVSCSDLQYIR